jgi:hypothetical protein
MVQKNLGFLQKHEMITIFPQSVLKLCRTTEIPDETLVSYWLS